MTSSSVGLGFSASERGRAHQHPRGAVTALERVVLVERPLERVELVVVGQPFDRRDRDTVGLDGEDGAALDEDTVEQDAAGTTASGVAADVRAG